MINPRSAGILLYRQLNDKPEIEVFLVHPGGPFFRNRDEGAWTIPKGEFTDEEPLQAAIREFVEETGFRPAGPFSALDPVRQKSGKWVYAWAAEGDLDAAGLVSNEFILEWPPKSGKSQAFPEVDRGEWFSFAQAALKINSAQISLLEQLARMLSAG